MVSIDRLRAAVDKPRQHPGRMGRTPHRAWLEQNRAALLQLERERGFIAWAALSEQLYELGFPRELERPSPAVLQSAWVRVKAAERRAPRRAEPLAVRAPALVGEPAEPEPVYSFKPTIPGRGA